MDAKDLVRRFYGEVATDGHLETLDDILTDDFVVHGGPGGGDAFGAAAITANLEPLHAAFSGLTFEVDDIIAEGDRVAARWTMRGKHTAEWSGHAATGAVVEQRGTVFYRVAAGRLAEQWILVDVIGLIGRLEAAA